jgi:iron complex transport system ATP-binding protein
LYTELSGGEKQRTQLARALAQIDFSDAEMAAPQRYLLLDEPTASLDLGHQQQLMRAIRDLAKQGVVVVVIVHDVSLAARYADKLLALQSGKVLAFGAASEVVTEAVIQVLYQVDVKVIQHPETGKPVVLGV